MQVKHIYSWASLYVRDDLRAEGLVVTVYNDFTFQVDGKLHAAGFHSYDKGTFYEAGELGFALVDNFDTGGLPSGPQLEMYEAGLRRLRPEFISAPGSRDEVEEESSIYVQPVDHEALRKAMHAGQPMLRETPAPEDMPHWLETAIDYKTEDGVLLELIGKDPLVDQLMAARYGLSPQVAKALVAGGDPIVQEWLPEISAETDDNALLPGVALRLAEKRDTDDATLERIARSEDAEVRLALAERGELPPALVQLLAQDPSRDVREAILGKGFNVLALEPAQLEPLVHSANERLAAALVAASLSFEQVDALLPRLDRLGQIRLAESVWRQSLGAQTSRMSADERLRLIDRMLAPDRDDEARTLAFIALDGAQQIERIERLKQGPTDQRLLMRLGAPEFVDWLLDLLEGMDGDHAPAELGHNMGLNAARQRRILELSAKASDDKREEALADLAANPYLDRDVLIDLIKHALQSGLRPHSDLSDALHNRRDLSPEAIALLLSKRGYGEEMVLSLLNQAHADAGQVKGALSRWYGSGDTDREVRALAALDGEAFFRALAEAESSDLREVAAVNHATPADLIEVLLNDPEDSVRRAATSHPSVPVQRFAERIGTVETWRSHWDIEAPAAVWRAVAERQTGLSTRLKAQEWAAIAELEARRRARP